LRSATRRRHDRVDALPSMRRLMARDYTTDEYARHLGLLFGFYEPFEAALTAAATECLRPDVPRRSDLLARDLAALGASEAAVAGLPRCTAVPRLRIESVAGAYYVYEGASLGAQVIGERLQATLGPANVGDFYRSNAAARRHRWDAFCETLEHVPEPAVAAVCACAVAVFRSFERWVGAAASVSNELAERT
jgi:heme oxygenase